MSERRIPPSEQIRQQIDELLNNGIQAQDNPLNMPLRLGAQLVVQEASERETTERLGRAWYQHRRPGESLRGHRNSYEPGRLRTTEGEITVQVQVQNWVEEEPITRG
jgi:hypothetical protein